MNAYKQTAMLYQLNHHLVCFNLKEPLKISRDSKVMFQRRRYAAATIIFSLIGREENTTGHADEFTQPRGSQPTFIKYKRNSFIRPNNLFLGLIDLVLYIGHNLAPIYNTRGDIY